MDDFSECAGNGLTRCLVCNSIVCETWCPRYTLDPDESDGDKARRLRVCIEIVGLREIVESRDEEIARLRKVVEAAKIVDRDGLIYSDFEAELLHKALAKLDEITKK